MNTERVREGEWNEAICFWHEDNPRTEIAAQFCHDHWNIWYIARRFFVIVGNIKEKEKAETMARHIANDVLNRISPIARAEEIQKNGWFE